VGRRPDEATVVVTRGLLDTLDVREREAVLAHELAHVTNRDVTVTTLAYFLPTLTYLAAVAAFFLLRGVFHGLGAFEDVDGDGVKGLVAVVVVRVVSAVLTLAVSVLLVGNRARKRVVRSNGVAGTDGPVGLRDRDRGRDEGPAGPRAGFVLLRFGRGSVASVFPVHRTRR
jgi:hypothetical protein